MFGWCPNTRDWIQEPQPMSGSDWVPVPPDVPDPLDDTDTVMQNLARKKIHAYIDKGHGFYFWNFRTELFEPQWSFMEAVDRGWIPVANDKSISKACQKEESDSGYKCVLKSTQIDRRMMDAVRWIFESEHRTGTPEAQRILALSGEKLRKATEQEVYQYYVQHHKEGGTCDFGGIAMLVDDSFNTLESTGTIWDRCSAFANNDAHQSWFFASLTMAGVALLAFWAGSQWALRNSRKKSRRFLSTTPRFTSHTVYKDTLATEGEGDHSEGTPSQIEVTRMD